MALGLEQEYLVVHGDAALGTASVVHESAYGYGLPQVGSSTLPSTFALQSSIESTHVDLDGDGLDEWAIAGIKTTDSHTVRVTTFRFDPNQAGQIANGPVYEYTSPASIVGVKVAAAQITSRAAGNSRQQLIVALREGTGITVLVLGGDAANATIQQASNTSLAKWTMPSLDNPKIDNNLRLATGDTLLEQRDQIVLMGTTVDDVKRVYYVLRYDDVTLSATRFSEVRATTTPVALFDLRVADVGGSPKAELVIHDQTRQDGQPSSTYQLLRYFTTLRDPDTHAVTAIDTLVAPAGPQSVLPTTNRKIAVAVGDLNRGGGAEIVVVRQRTAQNDLQVDLYQAVLNLAGNPAQIVTLPGTSTIIEPMFASQIALLDVAIADADTDGIGDIVVAVKDQKTAIDTTPILKLRTYGMARPDPNPNFDIDPTTFAAKMHVDYPAASSNNTFLHVDRIDFDGDSVLADIGSNCQLITESLLRSVVHLPPYWTLLQAGNGSFLATIGQTSDTIEATESTYGTFTSHDISGYIGGSVGGDILGIGAKVGAKLTAGYNYQSGHGEVIGSEISTALGHSQNATGGEALVALETDNFNCYTYDVHSLGVAGGSIRSCEAIQASNLDYNLDMVYWDKAYAATGPGTAPPAHWVPLAPDWASVALFRAPAANFFVYNPDLQINNATDGLFATSTRSPPMVQPYIEIDLGNIKPLTNVRVFPAAGERLGGLSLYVSATPFSGAAPPSGPGVTIYNPDPQTGNGYDHWNVWLRDSVTQLPRAARYLRLQAAGLEEKTLSISEIQAFTDVHVEPPGYPQSVCDADRDGLFTALMFDSAQGGYRKVDVRGQLLWSGFGVDSGGVYVQSQADLDACGPDFSESAPGANDGVQHFPIWSSQVQGPPATGVNKWDMRSTTANSVGANTSITHSTRIGAQMDAEGGLVVQLNAGGSYDFTSGITEENSTTMYWKDTLQYAGEVPGFKDVAGVDNNQCRYLAQPFAYVASERSNGGFQQQYTVVDYVVRDLLVGVVRGATNWSRCYAVPVDRFFASGFE